MQKDNIYIKGLKEGDEKIIQTIYEEYLSRIEAMVFKNNGTKDDAWGVFQESLIILLDKISAPQFKLTSSFYTLLYGISRFVWSNERKKKYRKEVTILDTYTYSKNKQIDEILHQEEQLKLYQEKFKELGERCRQLLQLFFNGEKYEVIWRKLGYASLSSAKKQKHKCQKQLIAKIKSDTRFKELSYGS